MHSNTDEDGFIKKMTFTATNVHDSQELDKLVKGCGGQIYGDSAYANKKNDKKFGVKNNKILHRAYRNKPLTKVKKREIKQDEIGVF
jgi:IS5 family transposase